MSRELKRNSLLVLGLAVLFYWAFMYAKHDPMLRPIIPFGDDPYDAVGSFACITGVLVAVVSLVRAFRPYRGGTPTSAQRLYLVRSQEAVVLAVLITIAADAIAMVRHPSLWIVKAARVQLVALVIGMAVVAGFVEWIVRRSHDSTRQKWQSRSIIIPALVLLVLAFYPENLIANLPGHLATVIVGDIVLFATMRTLLVMLIPLPPSAMLAAQLSPPKRSPARRPWLAVVCLGVLVGLFAFAGEASEGTPLPLGRTLIVACVFIGLCLAGLLMAYAFLGKPLGLQR